MEARMPALPREIVDSYLTKGAYDYWQKLSAEALRQRARFDSLRKRFRDLDRDVTIHIDEDFMWLEKLSSDYNAGMRLVESGHAVSKAELDSVFEMYSIAADLAQQDNDSIYQIVVSDVVDALARFPFKLLAHREKEFAEIIERLSRDLAIARSFVRETRVQLLVDVAITALSFVPSATLIIKLEMTLLSYVTDELLGVEKGKAAEITGKANKVAGVAAKTVGSIKDLGDSIKGTAKAAGHVTNAVQVVLSAHEMQVARSIRDRLQEELKAAQRAFDALYRLAEKHAAELVKLKALIVQVAQRVRHRIEDAEATRDELHSLLRDNRYSNHVAKQWTVLQPAAVAN
jgi:hypothetical protein